MLSRAGFTWGGVGVLLTLGGLVAMTGDEAAAQTVQEQRDLPPVGNGYLPPRPDCERYRGTGTGNSVWEAEAEFCVRGQQVTGLLQTRNPETGLSRRAWSGTLIGDGQGFVMRDVRFATYDPGQDWQFCLVERYELPRTPDGNLRGTYEAPGCDRGTLVLTRLPGSSALGFGVAPPVPDLPERRSWFGCGVAPVSASLYPVWFVLACLGWRRRSRG